jgi:hypothetical protein
MHSAAGRTIIIGVIAIAREPIATVLAEIEAVL